MTECSPSLGGSAYEGNTSGIYYITLFEATNKPFIIYQTYISGVFFLLLILQVANKLFPLTSIAKQIEDFAKEMLLSVVSDDAMGRIDTEGSVSELQKVLDY